MQIHNDKKCFNRVSKSPASNAQSIKRWVGGLTCLTPKASLVEWEYKLLPEACLWYTEMPRSGGSVMSK